MFEDSTFESTGKIKTRSRRWMLLTLALNGTILTTLILMPLIYPDALPHHMLPTLLVAPEAPKAEVRPEPVRMQSVRPHNFTDFDQGRLVAPGVISRTPLAPTGPELPFIADNRQSWRGERTWCCWWERYRYLQWTTCDSCASPCAGVDPPLVEARGGNPHLQERSAIPADCKGNTHGGDGCPAGNDFEGGHDRGPARDQWIANVAAGGDRCGEDLALQALHVERAGCRSGDNGECDLQAAVKATERSSGLHPSSRRIQPDAPVLFLSLEVALNTCHRRQSLMPCEN
jgi:hypothetical protein